MARRISIIKRLGGSTLVVAGAVAMTLVCFLVLPLIQAIGRPPETDSTVRSTDQAMIEPPPQPPEPEEEEPEEPEEKPELEQEDVPLDLSQIEIALNPGTGGAGALAGNFNVNISDVVGGDGGDGLFNLSELDQRPRAVYQPSPRITPEVRRHAPGKVSIIFIVNKNGRVEKAKVQGASHPALAEVALEAVRQWKFEPGKRQGQAVRFRMRVPITFPKL